MAIVRDLFWNPRFVMSTFAHRKCHFVSCFRSPYYRNEQMAFKNELMLNTFQNKQSFNLFCKIFLIENTFVALPYQWMAWIAGLIPWPLLYSAYREWRVAKRCWRWQLKTYLKVLHFSICSTWVGFIYTHLSLFHGIDFQNFITGISENILP